MTLLKHVERYLAGRDVSRDYAKMLRAHCRAFTEWYGCDAPIKELDCDAANAWLASMKDEHSPYTVDTYRRNLLAVWRDAYMEGLNDNPPLRLRQIKKPRRVVEAYTLCELRQLLASAAKLKGRHRNGNRRSDFWCAMIHAAYSTGLRRGDLLLVFRRDIAHDGTLSLVQHKTGIQLRVRFSLQALKYIDRLKDANGLALPWPYRKDAIAPRFKKLRNMGGVVRGTLKWVRRAAGSYAEREQPGNGPKLLGNGPQVFRDSYEDRTITGEEPPSPPPLD